LSAMTFHYFNETVSADRSEQFARRFVISGASLAPTGNYSP
jgi:hypothetical protein